MSAAWAIAGAAVITAVLYASVQDSSPVFALMLSLAAACVILLRIGSAVQGAFGGIFELARRADSEAFASLARCAGILLLTDYAKALCDEAGAQSLAWCTSLAGRCLVLAAAWPLLREICARIWELTG